MVCAARLNYGSASELLLIRLNAQRPIDSIENRFRRVVLEILNRLPNNELLRPYTSELLRIATETLANDNEDNALTCLRIVFDLHKSFRPALEGEVQAFLDLVRRLYRILPVSVKRAFLSCTSSERQTIIYPANTIHSVPAPTSSSVQKDIILPDDRKEKMGHQLAQLRTPLRGLDSFKVLTECPLIVMLLFQLYPRYIQDNIPQLTPLMMAGLSLRAPPTALRLARERYREFVACQVKTLSFLTYLLRGFSDLMKPYQDAISKSVIALLLACPGDAVATRKELLVATRHILATDFRSGFYPHVDLLIDEDVLVGNGRLSQESLRPLAFSTVADLVHHVRSKLSLDQLARIVVLFSKNLHDSALPLTVQTTSVRLLLNLVDYIFHNIDSNLSTEISLLVCILRGLVAKLETLRWLLSEFANPKVPVDRGSQRVGHPVRSLYVAASDKEFTSLMLPSIHFSIPCGLAFADYAPEIRVLLCTVLRGLKAVLWCVLHHRQTPEIIQKNHTAETSGKLNLFSQEEGNIISAMFEWGIDCCQLLIHKATLCPAEEKELLDNFAGVFTVLNRQNLQFTIGRNIPLLFTATLNTPEILSFSQLLLANTSTSISFADVLLSFLIDHLCDLAHLHLPNYGDTNLIQAPESRNTPSCRVLLHDRASMLLRLFNIVFGSISLFADNESVLHGRVQILTLESLRLASIVHRPVGYLLLLRGLFRSLQNLSSGASKKKLRKSHLEVEDMLPAAMGALRQLRQYLSKSHALNLLVIELCITVPVHSSSMNTTLCHLLEPLSYALRLLGHNIAALALRTFEYYLDYLGVKEISVLLAAHPALADSILSALYLHLRPRPYSCGTLAIRILGKLGGHNRLTRDRLHLDSHHPRELIGNSRINSLRSFDTSTLSLVCSWRHDHNEVLMMLHETPKESAVNEGYTERIKRARNSVNLAAGSSGKFILPLHDCLDATCDLFQTLLYASQRRNHASSLDTCIGDMIAARYRSLCFKFITCALDCLIGVNAVCLHTPAAASTSSAYHANVQFHSILYCMLSATTDHELSMLATPLVHGLCRHFSLLLAQTATGTLDSSFGHESDVSSQYHADIFPLPGSLPGSLSLYAMNHMLVYALQDPRLRIQRCAVQSLRYLVAFATGPYDHTSCLVNSKSHARGLSLVSDLIFRLCKALYSPGLYARRAVCHSLHYLLPLLDSVWVDRTSTLIVKSLLHALTDHDVESSVHTVNDIVCTLCLVVRLACNFAGSIAPRIALLLLSELGSKQPAKRVGAQSGLVELNVTCGLPQLSAKILPMHRARTLAAATLKALVVGSHLNTLIGNLDCTIFFLSTQPPLMTLDYTFQCVLLSLMDHIQTASSEQSRETSNNLHMYSYDDARIQFGWQSTSASFCSVISSASLLSSFSFACVQQHLLHAALLRVLHAGLRTLFTAVKGNSSTEKRLSIKHQIAILEFTFWSMSHSTPVVACAAESLVYHILANSANFKYGVLTARLDSVLHQFSHGDGSLQLYHFREIQRLVLVPAAAAWQSKDFFSKVFSCLDSCINVLRASSYQRDSRIVTVSCDLLFLLSCSQHLTQSESLNQKMGFGPLHVVQKAIYYVIKLEGAFLKIPCNRSAAKCIENKSILVDRETKVDSSWSTRQLPPCTPATPFRRPLACVLSRYAHDSITYFLQDKSLLSKEQVTLLRATLIIPDADALRCRFMSEEGTYRLLETLFGGTMCALKAQSHIKRQIANQQRNYVQQCLLGSCEVCCTASVDYNHTGVLHSSCERNAEMNAWLLTRSHGSISMNRALHSPASIATMQYHGISILHTLQHLRPILSLNSNTLKCLCFIWRQQRVLSRGMVEKIKKRRLNSAAPSPDSKRAHLIMQCFISYSRLNQGDVNVLFDVLAMFAIPGLMNLTLLKRFLCREVARGWAPEHKRSILYRFLRLLVDRTLSSEMKILALRFVVTPMFVFTFEQQQSNKIETTNIILSSELIKLFMHCSLGVANYATGCYNEALRVELLKLTTVLIEHLGFQLVEHRKELIKFAWNHLKSEDSFSKQWAYVNVCRFIATYETPPKIILQVYVALLRTFHPEARELVKIALDVLLPALPVRLPPPDFVKAMKWSKKIMYEEGHALPQLIHIWQIIIRHPLLFFAYRMQFVPQMVNSLNRLGLPPNCPIENRQLAVALADTIISWELHHRKLPKEKQGDALELERILFTSVNKSAKVKSRARDTESSLTRAMIELITNFLVRLALFSSDNKEPMVKRLAVQCVDLLKVSLAMWPGVHIRFSYFEKIIHTSNTKADSNVIRNLTNKSHSMTGKIVPYSAPLLSTCLDVFIATVDVSQQPNPFFMDNVLKAQQLVLPCFDFPGQKIELKLHYLLRSITTSYPPSRAAPSSSLSLFYQNLKNAIERILRIATNGWNFTSHPPLEKCSWRGASPEIERHPIIYSALSLLEKISGHIDYAANHGNSLMQLAQQLAVIHMTCDTSPLDKEGLAAMPTMSFIAKGIKSTCRECRIKGPKPASQASQINTTTACALGTCVKLIGRALQLNSFVEARRPFVALLFGCLEDSKSMSLLSSISCFVGKWIGTPYGPLTQQEKIAFVDILGNIDRLDEADAQPLLSHFLGIIQRLDHSPTNPTSKGKYADSPAFVKPFAAGLVAPHAATRSEFRQRFMRRSVEYVGAKVIGLFKADWTPLSARFWLVVVVEVLLDSVDLGTLTLDVNTARLPAPGSCGSQREHTRYKKLHGDLALIVALLKELAHAHLGLAQCIFEVLSAAACINAIKYYGKRVLQQALSQQLLETNYSLLLEVPGSLPGGTTRFVILPSRAFVHGEIILDAFDFSVHRYGYFGVLRASEGNVPQSLLRLLGIHSMLSDFPPRVLFELASKYNYRHDVIAMVENRIMETSAQPVREHGREGNLQFEGAPTSLVRLLLAILEDLSEDDLGAGVMCSFTSLRVCHFASRLRRYGCIAEAQRVYFGSIEKNIQLTCARAGSTEEKSTALALEFCEGEWFKCAQDLKQWNVLAQVSGISHEHGLAYPFSERKCILAMDSCWKTGSANRIKDVGVLSRARLTQSSPHTILNQIRSAVVERHFSDVEGLCTQCITSALALWYTLPYPAIGFNSGSPLLQLFHELIEVHEAGQLLHGALEHARCHTRPDIQGIIQTWRDRLPNSWESTSIWDNILRWREFCFSLIRHEFESRRPEDRSLLLDDSSWIAAVNMKVARKHGLAHPMMLPQMPNLAVGQTFTKLRETIVFLCNSATREGAMRGLNFVNYASMNFSHLTQRVELLRLKGILLGVLGQPNNAHAAFSCATALLCSYGRAWLAWAVLCEVQHSQCNDTKTRGTLLTYSVACYLAAIECGDSQAYVCGIARILCILRFHAENLDFATLISERLDASPSWVWVPWVNQLLAGLMESSQAVACSCLVRMAVAHPQDLYYGLNAELEFQRDCSRSKVRNSFTSHMKLVRHQMQASHYLLSFEMDVFCDELVDRFEITIHEGILAVIDTLLHGFYNTIAKLKSPVPSLIREAAEAAFTSLEYSARWVPESDLILFSQCLDAFRCDFIEPSSVNLRTTIYRLMRWKCALTKSTSTLSKYSRFDPARSMSKIFWSSVTHMDAGIEIPGQHNYRFAEPQRHTSPSVMDVGSYFGSEKCYHSTGKHISLATHGGQKYSFLVHITRRLPSRICEISAQLFAIIDYTLIRSVEAQKRRMRTMPLTCFAVGPNLQFVSNSHHSTTLSSIDELRCTYLHIDPEAPFLCARQHATHSILRKERLFYQSKYRCLENFKGAQFAAYYEVCRTLRIETDTVSRYICAGLDTAESLWTFRRSLAKSMGVQAFVSYLLKLGGFKFSALKVCPRTACTFTAQLRSKQTMARITSGASEVAFRLSRNLISLMQPMIIDSVFSLAIGLTAIALQESAAQPGGVISPYCRLFFENHFLRRDQDTRNIDSLGHSIIEQLKQISPACRATAEEGNEILDIKIKHMVDSSQNPFALSLMKPTWQPWL